MGAASLPRRLTGAALVLLLHLVLLLALLRGVINPPRPRLVPRETILRFLPVPRMPLPTARAPAARQPVPRSLPVPEVTVPSPLPAPVLRNLGQSLFGCAPENLGNLSAEERARCSGMVGRAPGDSDVAMPRSHVKDPARRAAEMRAKNTQGHLPCAMLMNAPAPYGGTQIVPGFNPGCAVDRLVNGVDAPDGLPP